MKRSTIRLFAAMLAVILFASTLDMSVFGQKVMAAESLTEELFTVSGNDSLVDTVEKQNQGTVNEDGQQEEFFEDVVDYENVEEMTLWELMEADLTQEEFKKELAKIKIDCEKDPETYEMWKILMTDPSSFYGISLMGLTDGPANNIIGNDYVEIWALNGSFTIGTTGGNPELKTDDNKKMIYGHPGASTSYTTIRVGKNSYKYTANNGVFDVEKKAYVSSNTFDGVTVEQEIKIVKNKSTNREEVVQIKYTAKNNTGASVNVGARIMLDTMLGNNDAAPFKIPGVGSVTSERQFTGSDIPKYWQAFDSLTNPGVVSQGRFIVDGYISPDIVQFTNWSRVHSTLWNYQVSSGSNNGDSAVSAIWNEKALPKGGSREYVTYYGLSEFEGNLLPPLAVAIASDAVMKYEGENSVKHEVTAYIQNISGATATNVKATIELPTELKLISGVATRSIGTITNNAEKQLDWIIGLDTKSPKNSYEIKIKVTADGCEDKIVKKTINVERDNKAIIIVPGIAGTKLYTSDSVDAKTVLGNSYKGTFAAGTQLWDPSASEITSVGTKIRLLGCDSTGSSKISIYTEGTGNGSDYGAKSYYTKLVKALKDTYSNDYDVQFWGYDWRMDVSTAAGQLESFINNKEYSSVILVCHSMGGLVASKYLANSTLNQEKVDKLITLGTPYLGAPKALYVFETGALLGGIGGTVTSSGIKEVANNFTSVYELLPTSNYFSLNSTDYVLHRKKNTGLFGGYTETRYDYNQTKTLIQSRSFASGKSFLTTAENFANSLFVNGSHITNTVDSYYIIGYGKDTILQVREQYDKNGNFDKCDDIGIYNGGDETVPVLSANIGNTLDSNKTYYVKDTHTGMLDNKNVIALVKNIVDDNPGTFDSSISKTCPTKSGVTKIKLKISCPVDLVMVNENGEEWAHVNPEYIVNDNPEEGSFYVLGKDNDEKIAYLNDKIYNVKLLGTGNGTMTYTLSVREQGFTDDNELLRIVFDNVPLTETTIITTTTDYSGECVLNMDEDGDGIVDYQIYPTRVMSEEQIDKEENNELNLDEVSAITSNKYNAIQINGSNVVFNNAVLADGICNFYTSKDVVFNSEQNSIAKLYQNNSVKTTLHDMTYADVKSEIERYFADMKNVLPKGVNSYGTTDAFYNITAPINNIITDNSVVLSTSKLTSVDNCVVYSRKGDVSAYISDMNFNGVIYAPNGTVTIYGSNINIHGTIIADKIVINGTNVIFD